MERTSNLQNPTSEKNLSGWINGFIGVVIFSASLPATKVAVLEFDPVFDSGARQHLPPCWHWPCSVCSRPADRSAASCWPSQSWPAAWWSASPADRPGPATCNVGAYHCVSRPVAPVHGGIRGAARGRATTAGLLVFLGAGQRVRGGLCPLPGPDSRPRR